MFQLFFNLKFCFIEKITDISTFFKLYILFDTKINFCFNFKSCLTGSPYLSFERRHQPLQRIHQMFGQRKTRRWNHVKYIFKTSFPFKITKKLN
jgi:hypothetical protein